MINFYIKMVGHTYLTILYGFPKKFLMYYHNRISYFKREIQNVNFSFPRPYFARNFNFYFKMLDHSYSSSNSIKYSSILKALIFAIMLPYTHFFFGHKLQRRWSSNVTCLCYFSSIICERTIKEVDSLHWLTTAIRRPYTYFNHSNHYHFV